MKPRWALAQTWCIAERRSRSSRVSGTMKLIPTRSPVVGRLERHRVDEVGSMLEVVERGERRGAVRGGGMVVGSVIRSPSTHRFGGFFCNRASTSCAVRAALRQVIKGCTIVSMAMCRRSPSPTPTQSESPDRGAGFVDRAVAEAAARVPDIDTAGDGDGAAPAPGHQRRRLRPRIDRAPPGRLELVGVARLFTLWISGPLEPSRLAELSGMSRQAVSALAKTLEPTVSSSGAPPTARCTLGRAVDHRRRPSASAALPRPQSARGEWAGALDPDERATLTHLLTKLADAPRTVGQPPLHRTRRDRS
jgi:hypothetical protein